ncbi:MAG: phosphatidic acid phosphatase [Clostridia bacterium]|nr:phosphatidic acid phosphatase [Clostridia bacterium]
MRKPVVDYREFSFKGLNDPRFSHLKLLGGWFIYFALYLITENLIPNNSGTAVSCWLDYKIPFCEWFIIPYVGWYALIVVSLLYFALYNVDNFKRLQIFIIVTQVVAMIIYIAFPNYQPLRPDYPRDNFLTDVVILIQNFDTNSNVCPSLHVAYSIGIASVWLKEKSAAWWTKTGIVIFCILVCLSTVFVKQHSVVDGLVAIPVCLLAEYISCKSYWKEKLKSKA